jgi:hypothetical protein
MSGSDPGMSTIDVSLVSKPSARGVPAFAARVGLDLPDAALAAMPGSDPGMAVSAGPHPFATAVAMSPFPTLRELSRSPCV